MKKEPKSEIQVAYTQNGKDEPERLTRVYDMLFSKIINKLHPKNEKTQT